VPELVDILKTKSVLLLGGSLESREGLVSRTREGWRRPGKTGVFTLKSGLKTNTAVLKAFARDLPITSPLKLPGSEMSLDAINDYWLEWPAERQYDSALIIWPEVQVFAGSEPEDFCRHLATFLRYMNLLRVAGKTELRLLVTSRDDVPLAIDSRDKAVEALAFDPKKLIEIVLLEPGAK
jgi:hypothetical protein